MQQVPQVLRNSLPQPQPHLPEPMRAVVPFELFVLEFSVLLSRVFLSKMNLRLLLRLLQAQLEVEEWRQDVGLRHPAIS